MIKRAIETYRQEPIARFFFWIVVAAIFICIGLITNYYVQIEDPQKVPDFATTEGVVGEASKRYLKLKGVTVDINIYPANDSGSPQSGLAGYFIPTKNLGNITEWDTTFEEWGKWCEVYDSDKLYYSDGALVVLVMTSGSDPRSVQICENNLPPSVTAYEVVITQGEDENLYYIFRKVILPVRYVLNFQ